MAAFNKFNCLSEDLAEKVHNLGADTLKVVLTNVAPVATNTTAADLTEIAAGNGYTAGGTAATISSSSQTSGTYKLVLADVVFTASGGAIASSRYAVLNNSTANKLVGWWDRGSSVSPADGETLTIDFDATNGVVQLA